VNALPPHDVTHLSPSGTAVLWANPLAAAQGITLQVFLRVETCEAPGARVTTD